MSTLLSSYVPKHMQKLHDDINRAIFPLEGLKPSPFDMMAICWLRTLGNFWYDCSDCLYKRRLVELEDVTGVKTWEFLQTIRCGVGQGSGRIPRFVFDATAFKMVRIESDDTHISLAEKVLLSCGIGIASQFFCRGLSIAGARATLEYMREFKRSEVMQLQSLASEMVTSGLGGHHANVNLLNKFAGYGMQCKTPGNFGERVAALSEDYARYYEHTERADAISDNHPQE